jgi:hypothetical protein
MAAVPGGFRAPENADTIRARNDEVAEAITSARGGGGADGRPLAV